MASTLLVVALSLPARPAGGQVAPVPSATPIMGQPVFIADQLAAWFRSSGRTPNLRGVTLEQLAGLYVEEGLAEGVRGDVAFAQAVFETGYFAFSERVPAETNNFAGLGAPSAVAMFPDARTGVRAQIQHLRAYADPSAARTGPSNPLVDPRWDLVRVKGIAPTVEALSGRWSPGEEYGQKVAAVLERVREHAGPSLRGSAVGAPIAGLAEGAKGYWLLDEVGGVFTLGGVPFAGSVPALRIRGVPVGVARTVAVESTPTRLGYWILDEEGGVYAFGDARFSGSVPGLRLAGETVGAAKAVDLVPSVTGAGYWVLDEEGGVFAFGDARFHGSLPSLRASSGFGGRARAVDLAPAPGGSGYWVLDEFGGVFGFGTARFAGSIPGLRLGGTEVGDARIVGMAVAPGGGYWILDAAGGVFPFGGAPFLGSLAGQFVGSEFVTIVPGALGGYRLVTADGGVFSYVPMEPVTR